MFTVIFGIVIGIIVAIILVYIDNQKYGSTGGYGYFIFNGVIVGFLAGLILAFMLPMKWHWADRYQNLVALQENSMVTGKFFLGSGQINGTMKYVYYYEVDSVFKMEQLPWNKAVIRYTDSIPRIRIRYKALDKTSINLFAIDWCITDKLYEIQVPRGTIRTDYSLDAK